MSLKGTFRPPGDKSISHRVALMSLLAEGECLVSNISSGEDVCSSLAAVEDLGAQVETVEDSRRIVGANRAVRQFRTIDCGNSGTTMRLMMGILAGLPGRFILDGDDSLRRRPMKRVSDPLGMMGASIGTSNGMCPVEIQGLELQGIDYTLPVASAQLKSAILLAGVQAHGTTVVREIAPSRDHTEKLLAALGARISGEANAWTVQRSSLHLPESLSVPGDSSSAAFFLCAAAIVPGSVVSAEHVLLNPTRTGFVDVLRMMGADLEIAPQGTNPEPWGTMTVRYTEGLSGCTITPEQVPALVDEVPILALVATQATGTTVFQGVSELRVKETDRLEATASQLGAMGANVTAHEDSLVVEGPTRLTGATGLTSFNDHRIAMTLRLAGILAGTDLSIDGEESVNISYPGFHDTLGRLTS